MNQPPVPLAYNGYPSLVANTGTPYGESLTGPTQGMQNSRGGPTWGHLSISEPNTSPDVIAVRARPMYDLIQQGLTHWPAGTPIAIYSNDTFKPSRLQKDDPIHEVVRLEDMRQLGTKVAH